MNKDAHDYSFSDMYAMGNEHHWKVCTVCGVTDASNFVFAEVEGGYSIKQNGMPSFTTTVVLPEYYEAANGDRPITEIVYAGFEGNASLTEIVLPDGLTTIDYHAFTRCTSLTGITIPDSVTYLGVGAFYGCSAMQYINMDTDGEWVYEYDHDVPLEELDDPVNLLRLFTVFSTGPWVKL